MHAVRSPSDLYPAAAPSRCQYPPLGISYALVQATVGVGTVIMVYVILITYEM